MVIVWAAKPTLSFSQMPEPKPLKCDECGVIVPVDDIENGTTHHVTNAGEEAYQTLCKRCATVWIEFPAIKDAVLSRGPALLRAICATPAQEDGFMYAALGPVAHAELLRMADVLDISEGL